MKTRPKAFIFLTFFFVAVALAFPVQIMLLYGHGPLEFLDIVYKLSPMNWVVVLSSLTTAYFAWNASPALKILIPLNFLAVFWNNYLVAHLSSDFTPLTAILSALAFLGLHAVLLSPKALAVLKDPNRRWWLTESRVKIECPLSFHTHTGKKYKGLSFDLSAGGAFIPIPLEQFYRETPGSTSTAKNPVLTLKLSIGRFKELQLKAEVVRHSRSAGKYPEGIGVRFLDLGRTARSELEGFLKEHNMFELRSASA